MTKHFTTAPKGSAIGWRLQLVTGLALASMAIAAVRVDVLNNYEYGKTVSVEMATILGART
jgi:hypothetical protein